MAQAGQLGFQILGTLPELRPNAVKEGNAVSEAIGFSNEARHVWVESRRRHADMQRLHAKFDKIRGRELPRQRYQIFICCF